MANNLTTRRATDGSGNLHVLDAEGDIMATLYRADIGGVYPARIRFTNASMHVDDAEEIIRIARNFREEWEAAT